MSAHVSTHGTWLTFRKYRRMDRHICGERMTNDHYIRRKLRILGGSHAPGRMHCPRNFRNNNKLRLRCVRDIRRLVRMAMGCMGWCLVHVAELVYSGRLIDGEIEIRDFAGKIGVLLRAWE